MRIAIASAALVLALAGAAHADLVAGDIAITGYITNGSPNDSFSFVNLVNIPAGTVIYFTDNGWTGTAFRGSTATDGDGNENLIRFTANNQRFDQRRNLGQLRVPGARPGRRADCRLHLRHQQPPLQRLHRADADRRHRRVRERHDVGQRQRHPRPLSGR